jgi:hypothetical protein
MSEMTSSAAAADAGHERSELGGPDHEPAVTVLPAGRYRRGGLGRAATIRRACLVTLGVGALTVAATWYGLRNATPPITATVLAYHINSTHSVKVTFEVDRTTSKAAICVIEAPNLAGDDVGRRQITVPAGQHRVVLTTTVTTNGQAITGEVEECQLTG